MAETSESTLDALMARLAEGDRSAFTPVFERLWPPTLRLCSTILRNDADAADAAQQAMEKILVRASDYDPARPAMPWALAIASWECRTILRKRGRRKEVPEDGTTEPATFGRDEDPVQRELVKAAMNAMGTLSDTDREALVSTFWEEAASVRGATLRKRRERALGRLREAFKRLYGLD
jgi:RNA polymerase sigma-70 factor (ECF subfamily)